MLDVPTELQMLAVVLAFCPALTKLALDLHVNFCLSFRLSGLFVLGFWLGDLLTSGSGIGNPVIQLGVLSLAEQSHTQIF